MFCNINFSCVNVGQASLLDRANKDVCAADFHSFAGAPQRVLSPTKNVTVQTFEVYISGNHATWCLKLQKSPEGRNAYQKM
jgi:hypothetical protein